jgi:hypothetical protein
MVWGVRTHVASHLVHMTAGCSAAESAAFVVAHPGTIAVTAAQIKKQDAIVFMVFSPLLSKE